jgi:hypothetical protein
MILLTWLFVLFFLFVCFVMSVVIVAALLLRPMSVLRISIFTTLFVLSVISASLTFPAIRYVVMPQEYPMITGHSFDIAQSMTTIDPQFFYGVQSITTSRHVRGLLMQSRDGDYSPVDRTIWVTSDAGPGELREILVHEVHHDVWYYKMTDYERAEWQHIHETVPSSTAYGRTTVHEDFADSGMLYPQIDETRRAFLDKLYCRLQIVSLCEMTVVSSSKDEESVIA